MKFSEATDEQENLLDSGMDRCSPASSFVRRQSAKPSAALNRTNAHGFARAPPQLFKERAAQKPARGQERGGNAKLPRRLKSNEMGDEGFFDDKDEDKEEILGLINSLGSHLSRGVVDFLIDELERKMISDLAADMGGDGGDDGCDMSVTLDASSSNSSSNSSSSGSSSSNSSDDSFAADESGDRGGKARGFHDSMARMGFKPVKKPSPAGPPIGMLFVGRNDDDSDDEEENEGDQKTNLPVPSLKAALRVNLDSCHAKNQILSANNGSSETPEINAATPDIIMEESLSRFEESASTFIKSTDSLLKQPIRRQGSDRDMQVNSDNDDSRPSEIQNNVPKKQQSQRTNLGGSVREMNVSISKLESMKSRPTLRHHSHSVRNVKLHPFVVDEGDEKDNEKSSSSITVSIVDESNVSFPTMRDDCVQHIVDRISAPTQEAKDGLKSPPLSSRQAENPQDQDATTTAEINEATITKPAPADDTSKSEMEARPDMETTEDSTTTVTDTGKYDASDDVMDDLIALSVDPEAEAQRATRLKSFMPRCRSADNTNLRKEVSQPSQPEPKQGVPRSRSDKTVKRPGVQRNTSSSSQRFLEKKNSGKLMRMVRRNNSGMRGQERTPSFNKKMAIVRTSSQSSSKRGVQRKKSMDGLKRSVERLNSMNSKSSHSAASSQSGRRIPLRRKFSFGRQCRSAPSSSYGVFAADTVNDKASHEMRTSQRKFTSQNSMRRLMGPSSRSLGTSSHHGLLKTEEMAKKTTLLKTFSLPCGVKHECALLFVDISGFTKLSTMMKVEQLSKTINDYFQMIVEEVAAYGGDILKFAGDAIFAEWRSTPSTRLDGNHDDTFGSTTSGGLGPEKSVLTAAECAARVTEKCGNHPVYGEDGERLATLNLHCAIGFGEVVGVHLGNTDRLEYFIIGDPIQQVAVAMDMGSMGTVVASPECLEILEGVASETPKVIFSDAVSYSNPKPSLVKRKSNNGPSDENHFAERLDHWDLASLRDLKNLMSLYAHPVVAANPQTAFAGNNKPDAEIRDVFTVFIQPLVSVELCGDFEQDKKVLQVLHDILVIVNTQLRRFKGQLRQYILDDKGLVLIANFGLRGSTFPQMVERLAMPLAANVQPVLKKKLGVECKMGATLGKAYTGIIGGIERHEYAVLGPSVNLAARLMASKANKGFLVDEAVKRKAANRDFEELEPVQAKGYSEPVRIYEPALSHRSSWGSEGVTFVGRTKELEKVLEVAKNVVDVGDSAKMVLVSAEGGSGKSVLLAQATGKVQDYCLANSATHLILCHVCSEADSFQPLSAAGPLLLDVLSFVRRSKNEEGYLAPPGFDSITALAPAGKESVPLVMLGACRDAAVPDKYICMICRLLLDNSWPPEMDDADQNEESHEVARYIVSIFMKFTIHLDLILWAVDDMPHADEMSWRVIELLHTHSCNLMLLMASRPVDGDDLNIDLGYWNRLHSDLVTAGNFVLVEFAGLRERDLYTLVENLAEKRLPKWEGNTRELAKEVFVQSGGMPQLALQILKNRLASSSTRQASGPSKKPKPLKSRAEGRKTLGALGMMGLKGLTRQDSWMSNASNATDATDNMAADVGEHMLHKMDSLSPDVRTYLNLGALLGPTFDTRDIISVMERYKRIPEVDKEAHADAIRDSLEEAVQCGVIEDDFADNESSFCFRGIESLDVTYHFSHANWRKILMKTVLNSWKRDMLRLVAESLEAKFEAHDSNHKRAIKQLFAPFKGGKKAGKNLLVASELALKIGERMAKEGRGEVSKTIYEKALELWLAPSRGEQFVLTFEADEMSKPRKEAKLEAEEIEYIAMLYVALGRCCLLLLDQEGTFEAFQNCLDLLSKSNDFDDVSLLFSAYCGRFCALGLSCEGSLKNEQSLVEDLVVEASDHQNIVHVMQAMAVQAELWARHGNFYEAIDMVREIRNIYDPSLHSNPLFQGYAEDKCMQVIAMSAGWYTHISDYSEAKQACDFIMRNIEFLGRKDSHNIFTTLFPVICAMKDCQDSVAKVRDLYLEKVVRNEDKVASSPFGNLLEPIRMLLDLAVDENDSDTKNADIILAWALGDGSQPRQHSLNVYTGNLGLNADALVAELCLRLSTFPFPNIFESTRKELRRRATLLIESALQSSNESGVSYAGVVSLAGRYGINGDGIPSEAMGALANFVTFES